MLTLGIINFMHKLLFKVNDVGEGRWDSAEQLRRHHATFTSLHCRMCKYILNNQFYVPTYNSDKYSSFKVLSKLFFFEKS